MKQFLTLPDLEELPDDKYRSFEIWCYNRAFNPCSGEDGRFIGVCTLLQWFSETHPDVHIVLEHVECMDGWEATWKIDEDNEVSVYGPTPVEALWKAVKKVMEMEP